MPGQGQGFSDEHQQQCQTSRRFGDPRGHPALSSGRFDGSEAAEFVRLAGLQRRGAAPAAAEGRLRGVAAHDRRGGRARPEDRRLRRQRDEGLGDRARRHALHALVPADDGLDRAEARLVHQSDAGRARAARILGQGVDQGRTGREFVPLRRHPRDVRSARLHRVGSDVAGVLARDVARRDARHPDRVRELDGRSARQEDAAVALVRSDQQASGATAASARREGRHEGVSDHGP